jgi:aspartate/glutamate racemase
MSPKLAIIHTIARLVPLYEELCQELMPTVARFHIADESLLEMLLAAHALTPAIYQRFADDAVSAERAGADVILLTCSSISPCVDPARSMVAVPLLKIDEPMADRAVALGTRIGVVATADTTLKPTSDLVRASARAAHKDVVVETVLCEGAHKLMLAGDMARHDEIVLRYLRQAMERYDVIVLAQGSMARVAELIPAGERKAPILSSPRLGMERTRDVIMALPPRQAGD